MAVAVTGVAAVFDGQVRVRYANVTFDSSYATSGEALTASDFGLYNILAVFPAGSPNVSVAYDPTNKKLLAYKTNTTTATGTTIAITGLNEVPSATDLSALVCQVLVVGN